MTSDIAQNSVFFNTFFCGFLIVDRATPAPVAPPPMIITSVEIGEKSPASRYRLGDNPIVTPKPKYE